MLISNMFLAHFLCLLEKGRNSLHILSGNAVIPPIRHRRDEANASRIQEETVKGMSELRIFISSTMEDMKAEREALVSAIESNRFYHPVYAESFVARSESPKEVCLEEVRNSHVYMGIFKARYGYISDKDPLGRSVVELEYEEARNNGIPIFVFVDKTIEVREELLDSFLSKISDFEAGHWRVHYASTRELVRLALDSIERLLVDGYVDSLTARRDKRGAGIYSTPYLTRFRGTFSNE